MEKLPETIDWPLHRQPSRPRRGKFLLIIAVLAVIALASRAAIAYWVDLLWFGSLGYGEVFWKTLGLEWGVFAAFAALTFLFLLGAFLALKRAHSADLPATHAIQFGGQSFDLPVATVLRAVGGIGALLVALITGAAMEGQWPALALYWYAPRAGSVADPIFGRPLDFYLFTLPAWQIFAGWLLTLAVICCLIAALFLLVTGGARALRRTFQRLDSTAVAGALSQRRIPAVGACPARVYRPIRAAVRTSHHLRRRHLHRRARDASPGCCSCAPRWCWERRSPLPAAVVNAARALAGRGHCSGRDLLYRGRRGWLVRDHLPRQAQRARSREALHRR